MATAVGAGLLLGLTPPGMIMRVALMGVLGAAAASFRSLTVEIDSRDLKLFFGDGIIKRSFSLADIESASPMRTTPLMGWGIHWTGRGWLYNVYGLDAVDLKLKNGKHAFIGTDEPQQLANAINQSVRELQ